MRSISQMFLGVVIIFIIVFSLYKDIPGPAIFNDEAIYGRYALEIANLTFNIADELYSPLYPLFAAPFMALAKNFQSYVPIVFLNSLLVALSFAPLFLFSKIFFRNTFAFVVSLIMTLLPNSSLSAFTWAEPLYYLLIYSLIYIFWLALNTQKTKYYFLAGNYLGLAYLTKPTIMVPFLAMVIILVKNIKQEFSLKQNTKFKDNLLSFIKNNNFKNTILMLVTFLLYVFVWKLLLFNLSMRFKHIPKGYGADFILMLKNIIPGLLSFNFYNNILDQFAYYVSSTFLFGIVFFILNWIQEKEQKIKDFYLFIAIMMAGLISMYTLAFGKYNQQSAFVLFPYGRYLNIPIAFILILSFSKVINSKQNIFPLKSLIVLGVFFSTLLFFKSPLRSVCVAVIAKSPELSGFINIFFKGIVDYEFPKNISNLNNFVFTLFYLFLLLSMSLVLKSKLKYLSVLIFGIPSIILSYFAFYNVNNYMSSLSRQNNLVKYIGSFKDEQLYWDEHSYLIKQTDVIKEYVSYEKDFKYAKEKYKDFCYYCEMVLKYYKPTISKTQDKVSINLDELSANELNEVFTWYFIDGDYVFSHLTQYWRGRAFKDKFKFVQLQLPYVFNFVENSDLYKTKDNNKIFLRAPFHADSSWNPIQLFGLANPLKIIGTKNNIYSNDFTSYFKMSLPKGKYSIEITINTNQLPKDEKIDFNILLNKKTKIPIQMNYPMNENYFKHVKINYDHLNSSEDLDLSFEKNSGSIWTISTLKIIPQISANNYQYFRDDAIIVSMKNFQTITLPNNQMLKQIKNISDYYFVYKVVKQ